MNEVGINAGGIAPIKPELNRIRALRSKGTNPRGVRTPASNYFGLAPGIDSGATLQQHKKTTGIEVLPL